MNKQPNQPKRKYAAPVLTVHGTAATLTQTTSSGPNWDITFSATRGMPANPNVLGS